MEGEGNRNIGNPPSDGSSDWVVLIEKIEDPDPSVPVTAVLISPETASLEIGQAVNLGVEVQPVDATDKTVSWSSTEPSIATVNQNGRVIAVSEGIASITVQTNDGGYTASAVITVVPTAIAVTGISLTPASLTLDEGDSATLNVLVSPANATDKSVLWSSSAPSIATVNQGGMVSAVAEGSATINVETADGGFVATS